MPSSRSTTSANEPLLHAYQQAVSRMKRSTNSLETAMDDIQNTSIKLPSEQRNRVSLFGEIFVENTFTAWMDIADSFRSIFHELTEITIARTVAGDPIGDFDHQLLATASNAASAVQQAARSYVESCKIIRAEAQRDDSQESQSKRHTAGAANGFRSNKRPLDGDHHQSEARRVRLSPRTQDSNRDQSFLKRRAADDSDDLEPHRFRKIRRTHSPDMTPVSAQEPTTTSTTRNDKSSPPTRELRHNFARSHEDQPATSATRHGSEDVEMSDELTAESESTCEVFIPRMPGVQYVDVSAEVEERLRTKELRRKETKGDMKRKRRSHDNLGTKPHAGNATQQAPKPLLKRSKQSHVYEVS